MKRVSSLLLILLVAVGNLFAESMGQHVYRNEEIGIAFNYPKSFAIDKAQSKPEPLSVVFAYGEPPFSLHVLFKEITHPNTLEAFIAQEREQQATGGYTHEVKEKRYQIKGDIFAIEFIRTSEIGTIYYFVFPSLRTNKLFAFYHVTSKVADPNETAVKGYRLMRDSLEFLN